MSALAEAAAFLAQQWPVFPCGADKRPVTQHGFKDAVSDPAEARRLFGIYGAELIGTPTGTVSNLAVVDLDVKEGGAGLEWLAANQHRLPITRRHQTRSGGAHLLFAYPPGRRIRNSASRIAPGVDIRGEGGYIIVPPSAGYSIADDAMPAPMPGWLLDLLDPPQAPPAPLQRPVARDHSDGSKYGLAALESECRAVSQASPGTQEVTLNNAGLKLGALVAGGELPRDMAIRHLFAAGLQMTQAGRPWGAEEIRRKVERAIADGSASPRQAPALPERIPARIAQPQQEQTMDAGEAVAEGAYLREGPAADLPLLWFDDIEPVLDTADFVQGVLVEGSAAVIYGESNAGKTFFATDMALHVAAGMSWMGKRVEQGGVAYCVLEGGFGFRNRVAAWRRHHARDGEDLPFVAIPAALNLLDPEADTPRLIATIRAATKKMGMPVKLIVIDTLARAFAGGNENASEDMGALVRNMDLIRAETGATVLFIHHSGKDQAKGARGHSSLRAAVDTEIEVKADEETGIKTATIVKQREIKKGDAFTFTLDVVELGTNRHGEAVTTCVVQPSGEDAPTRGPRLSMDQQQALKVLHDTLAEIGETGFPGVPRGIVSIPEDWWRDRFYQRSKPGAERDTKRRAFTRASDILLKLNIIAMDRGRVWAI